MNDTGLMSGASQFREQLGNKISNGSEEKLAIMKNDYGFSLLGGL